MATKFDPQRKSARFRLALQRMAGDDPHLELNQIIYVPSWSFLNNSPRSTITDRTDSTGPRLRPEGWNSSLDDVRSEVTRDPASAAQNFEPENEEMAINMLESNTAQYLKGPALYQLVIGLMMAAFLLMIDSTILVTVGGSGRFRKF